MKRIVLGIVFGVCGLLLALGSSCVGCRAAPESAASRPAAQGATQPADEDLVSRQELLSALKAAPPAGKERREKMVELFKQAGLKDVRRQEIEGLEGRFNVVATLEGKTGDVIVVGAHSDCSELGAGVIDNWSGACMLAKLAQVLSMRPRTCTFVFAAFDLEETGRIGSRYYVYKLTAQEQKGIKAMVDLECLGISRMKVWKNGSADDLERIAAQVAGRTSAPLEFRTLRGATTDSSSFMAAGIPAVTFDSLEMEDFHLIDSQEDRFEAIKGETYYGHYRYVFEYLKALDAHTGKITAVNRE